MTFSFTAFQNKKLVDVKLRGSARSFSGVSGSLLMIVEPIVPKNVVEVRELIRTIPPVACLQKTK
ncbi:TPA: hypothetical protein DEA21_00390 [Candidatus Uhrbacteria bacterium]|nr:hypothetical protein [Candidatus Uhrbacteria bacterium]